MDSNGFDPTCPDPRVASRREAVLSQHTTTAPVIVRHERTRPSLNSEDRRDGVAQSKLQSSELGFITVLQVCTIANGAHLKRGVGLEGGFRLHWTQLCTANWVVFRSSQLPHHC